MIRAAVTVALVACAAWAGMTVGHQQGEDTVRSYLGPATWACDVPPGGVGGAECWQIPGR